MHFDKRKATEDVEKDRFAVNTEDPVLAPEPEEEEAEERDEDAEEVEEVGGDEPEDEEDAAEEEEAEVAQEEAEQEEEPLSETAAPEGPDTGKERNPDDLYPILIRCAAARGDSASALSLKAEYEQAKEQYVEREALRVIQAIEEGARSGTLLQEGGLFYREIDASLLEKIARMFDTKVTDGSVAVSDLTSSGTTGQRSLIISSDGTIQVMTE